MSETFDRRIEQSLGAWQEEEDLSSGRMKKRYTINSTHGSAVIEDNRREFVSEPFDRTNFMVTVTLEGGKKEVEFRHSVPDAKAWAMKMMGFRTDEFDRKTEKEVVKKLSE